VARPGESAAGSGDDAELVRVAARTHERDRYLAALLAPRSARADLIAIAALGGEIARVPSAVTEPMMGEIRLQWWRDAVKAAVAGEATGHPVADAAGAALRRHGLAIDPIGEFTDAIGRRLSGEPPVDEEALRSDLLRTEGTLFEIAWRIVAGPGLPADRDVLRAAAEAYGLARLVLEFPAALGAGRLVIPESRLEQHGVHLAALRAGDRPDGLRLVLAGLAADARRNLAALAPVLPALARSLRTALLPVALVEPYLRSLERTDAARPGEAADISPLTRVWRIWLAYRFGRL
jgi:phytoene synthase